jgi:DNA-directed RNA polymerase subunit alpha
MAIRLGKFQLPNRLVKDEEASSETYGKFVAEPFEGGYGHTIGNSLRRVLLSSIEGAAISSIKIEGVQHEFQSIDDIEEDVTDVILNLKKVLVVSHKKEPVHLMIDVTRKGEITAADIQADSNIEVINPDQVICTLDTERRFIADLVIKSGRGYVSGRITRNLISRSASLPLIPFTARSGW